MKTKALSAAFALAMAGFALPAHAPAYADVKSAAADGMVLQIKGEVALPRDAAWSRLLNPGEWWSSAHTYSGDAKNLSVDAVAGGCWCELWEGGEVEHGRVVYLSLNQSIRYNAPLGPLQGLGVSAVMTFTLADGAAAGSTALTVDMVVVGSSLSGLDKLAPIVHQVLAEQVKGFTTPK
jgi:hypothetical protein